MLLGRLHIIEEHSQGRGYTGHEHLPWFGLVNMNARLYAPATGRFLNPDPLVQAPTSTQSFNRYSYCLNNPLRYSDPTGMEGNIYIEVLIMLLMGLVLNDNSNAQFINYQLKILNSICLSFLIYFFTNMNLLGKSFIVIGMMPRF